MEKCQNCRKFGEKLFLRGERCLSPKCAVTRRMAPASANPGAKGGIKKRRPKKSEYGLQLQEKQKAKTEYGMRERQFRTLFEKAARSQDATGEALLKRLEMRFDNVVYRLGWAKSRMQARQFINHGHIKINGKVVDIPSYKTKIGEIIEPKEIDLIKNSMVEKAIVPEWLKTEKKELKAEIIAEPQREQIDVPVDEQLIVEFYSR